MHSEEQDLSWKEVMLFYVNYHIVDHIHVFEQLLEVLGVLEKRGLNDQFPFESWFEALDTMIEAIKCIEEATN